MIRLDKEMVLEYLSTKMAASMKENGLKIKDMGAVLRYFLTAIPSKEIILEEKLMVKEFILGKMEKYTMVNGNKV